MVNDDDRPAALLTKAQRAYIQGERDYRPSAEREVKKRIRSRIRASLADIELINRELELDELEKAVENGGNPSDLVAFAVVIEEIAPDYGTGVQGAEPSPEPETMLQVGVMDALRLLGQSWEEIMITIDRGDPLEELAEKDPSTLTGDELDQLLAADLLSREEYALAILEGNDEQ